MSVTIAFERLKKLKEEKGVSIKEISEATKINRYTLKRYFTEEEAVDKMTTTNIYRLSHFFNVSVDYLMGFSDVRNRIFICPDGDRFIPNDPVYHFACQEFVEYLVKNKGYGIEEIK